MSVRSEMCKQVNSLGEIIVLENTFFDGNVSMKVVSSLPPKSERSIGLHLN